MVRAQAVDSDTLFPLPQTCAEAVAQAAEAVKRGLEAGHTRQSVTVLLPIEQRRENYMFTESMDYPENASQIYATAGEIAKELLKELGCTDEVMGTRIDDDGIEGEPVGVYTTASKKFLVVMQPTADTLPKLRELEAEQARVMLLVNPQWRTKGNIVSDFGFGPWRKKAEDFVAKFVPTYRLTEQRIGAASTLDPATGDYMGNGGVARLLQVFPAKYQVFSIGQDGSSACIMQVAAEPTYKELEDGFRKSNTSLKTKRKGGDLATEEERLQQKMSTVTDQVEKFDFSLKSTAEIATAVRAGLISPADVELMDKSALRAALAAFDQPASGKVADLRKRLVMAMEKGRVK